MSCMSLFLEIRSLAFWRQSLMFFGLNDYFCPGELGTHGICRQKKIKRNEVRLEMHNLTYYDLSPSSLR